ncbi:hypothetical protein FJ977_05205 [Mesorhizobium sp. B2-1-3A]|nr:hypothetical protein FJ977_05205 [Mesorhizobium sp. B2-1-3A]
MVTVADATTGARDWRRRPEFVILERSKERSDAAQTLGSMPRRLPKNEADQSVTRLSSDSLRRAVGARPPGHGMDPRVSATSLRDCSTLG